MTISIPPGTDTVRRAAVVCLASATVAAVLVGTSTIAPAPARAACDNYQFKGGSLRIELDSGAWVTIPATGQTLGPEQAVVQHPGGGAFGNASGGITGRKIDFTIANWNKGVWAGRQTWFSGSIDDDGRGSGFYYVNTDGPAGWHTTDTLSCVAAPAVPAPAPMPKLPPPPQPPTDVISVSWGKVIPFVGLPVKVVNTSATLGYCTYDASAPDSGLPPYHRDFVAPGVSLPAEWIIPGFETGTLWDVVVSCTGDFDGQRVVIGRVDTTKKF